MTTNLLAPPMNEATSGAMNDPKNAKTASRGAAPANNGSAAVREGGSEEVTLVVSLLVGGQLCGLPVHAVRDVLGPQTITRVPLAAPEIAGNLNLRGRIVTTIDLRKRLGLPTSDEGGRCMSVVTEQGQELYALLVDRVLEVVPIEARAVAALPPTLASGWSRFGTGVFHLPEGLMIMLDVGRVLALMPRAA